MGGWRGFSKQTQGFRVRGGPAGEKQKKLWNIPGRRWEVRIHGNGSGNAAVPQAQLALSSFQKYSTPPVVVIRRAKWTLIF